MNADVRHTGMVTAGMIMERMLPRKTKITRLTSAVVMAIV